MSYQHSMRSARVRRGPGHRLGPQGHHPGRTLPHVLQVTDRVVVLRQVVRDAPTSAFDAESLLGTITGLIETP